jgi:hypothetical protein
MLRNQIPSLRESVRLAYSRAVSNPGEKHPFPVGEEFACSVGYAADALSSSCYADSLPKRGSQARYLTNKPQDQRDPRELRAPGRITAD